MSYVVIVSHLFPDGSASVAGVFRDWTTALGSLRETYSTLAQKEITREREFETESAKVKEYSVRGVNEGTGGKFGPFFNRYRFEERTLEDGVTHF